MDTILLLWFFGNLVREGAVLITNNPTEALQYSLYGFVPVEIERVMKPVPQPAPITLPTPYRSNGLRIQEIYYASGLHMPFHTHAEALLILNLEGTVQVDYRKQTHVMSPAMVTFLPEQERHANHFSDGVRSFEVVIGAEWLERLRQIYKPADAPMVFQNSQTNGVAMRLRRELHNQDDLTPLAIEALTLELFVEMARDTRDLRSRKAPLWLRQARDFLQAHFQENLSLEAIAAASGVHPSHLTRAFRQHYEITISAYIRYLRVQYACRLLRKASIPLSQIALDAGFTDQGHFSRVFKDCMGMTPREFQKQA